MMLGYPGAGKTTAARLIAELTHSELIWEDQIRTELFPTVTFSEVESLQLHNQLNSLTAELLQKGRNVVYDTSFNQYEDRERMYDIATVTGAETSLIWVQIDRLVAKERATHNAAAQPTRPLAQILGDMDQETFDRLCSKLEMPIEHEQYVTMDGTKITSDYVRHALGL